MPILTWHENVYSVGVEAIDSQHRELVRLINEAHEASRAGGDSAAVRALVQGMAEYAATHFADEEQLMGEAQYEGLAGHREDHATFVARAREYAAAVESGRAPEPAQVFHFLASWLSEHILEVDMAFGRHLKERQGP